jgi:hypothetical protein
VHGSLIGMNELQTRQASGYVITVNNFVHPDIDTTALKWDENALDAVSSQFAALYVENL